MGDGLRQVGEHRALEREGLKGAKGCEGGRYAFKVYWADAQKYEAARRGEDHHTGISSYNR